MAYIEHHWSTGEMITGDLLNHMEEGIGENDSVLSEVSEAVAATAAAVESLAIVKGDKSGAMVTVSDGSGGMPLRALTIRYTPTKSDASNSPYVSSYPFFVHTGRNLWGGNMFRDKWLHDFPSSANAWNESARTISCNAGIWSGKALVLRAFKPNTRYTIMLCLSNSNSSANNFQAVYTDGTSENFGSNGGTAKGVTVYVSHSGKTLQLIQGRNSGGSSTLYVDESGIFEGVVDASAFEPAVGGVHYVDMPSGNPMAGGTWNPLTGEVVSTWGYIASYAGESLPGAWMSSLDEYVPGTSPTIGALVIYEREEPLVFTVTPVEVNTLRGVNNMFGNVTPAGFQSVEGLEYTADAGLHIDGYFNPPQEAMIAESNIESGKYFTVRSALFLSTASIAAGEAIKPGTNCTPVSIADALNALNE